MESQLRLEYSGSFQKELSVKIPLSKSISNRVLILKAISNGGIHAKHYSEASDTKILHRCLENIDSDVYDAQDAGTAFRFLTAFAAIGNHEVKITGTPRMKQRPIKGLVEALQNLGAEITYLEKEGFPPVKVKPHKFGLQSDGILTISDTSSSQFISALMLIAPKIKRGLELSFPVKIPSHSYIQMTAEILMMAGIEIEPDNNTIVIPSQKFDEKEVLIDIERDWSGASYFYSLMSVGEFPKLLIEGLKLDSIQNDSRIADYFKPLGIQTRQTKKGIELSKGKQKRHRQLIFDFKNNPDLSMTVILAYALNKTDIKVKGIENLVIKESNRIEALQKELEKINVKLYKKGNFWQLDTSGLKIPKNLQISTYNDHRIAMAFSVLALKSNLSIDNPEVVNKSFPNFWDQLKPFGISTNLL